jgi:outer membrane protein assembly factor BamB
VSALILGAPWVAVTFHTAPGAAGATTSSQRPALVDPPGPWDWPTYGHDAQHTFHGRTTLTPASVSTLKEAWFFPTGDAVTATPTVVNATVYVGSWDTRFYAISLATGTLRWSYQLSLQDAVTPYPGETPRPIDSDGGLVTSSAWYQPGQGRRPPLVIFGGGYTLYALNALTGALFWRHDYTGQPWAPPRPDVDGARIFSSPVVADGKVLVGVDVDGQKGERGYIVAASLATGNPVWIDQTDLTPSGHIVDNGCGSVWSSGSVIPNPGLVVFSEADCDFSNPPPWAETVFALRISNGQLVWRYRPSRPDKGCDYDFGGTANIGLSANGTATFLGLGNKDGTYYALNPTTGRLRWKTNVVFGGFSGGFIGSTAYDGGAVFGSTGFGDFGRFEHGTSLHCDPSDPRDTSFENPSTHSFDAATGRIRWEASYVYSVAPTTVAGGMTFNGIALKTMVQVRDAGTGRLLASLPLAVPNWSGIATVGNAVILGIGTSSDAIGAGVEAVTPGGAPPKVP